MYGLSVVLAIWPPGRSAFVKASLLSVGAQLISNDECGIKPSWLRKQDGSLCACMRRVVV
jgi:hypothetical protein